MNTRKSRILQAENAESKLEILARERIDARWLPEALQPIKGYLGYAISEMGAGALLGSLQLDSAKQGVQQALIAYVTGTSLMWGVGKCINVLENHQARNKLRSEIEDEKNTMASIQYMISTHPDLASYEEAYLQSLAERIERHTAKYASLPRISFSDPKKKTEKESPDPVLESMKNSLDEIAYGHETRAELWKESPITALAIHSAVVAGIAGIAAVVGALSAYAAKIAGADISPLFCAEVGALSTIGPIAYGAGIVNRSIYKKLEARITPSCPEC